MQSILSQQVQLSFLLALLLWSCHGKEVHGLLLRRQSFRNPRPPSGSASLFQPLGSVNQTVARRSRRDLQTKRTTTSTTRSQDKHITNEKTRLSILAWVFLVWNYVKVHSILMAVQVVLRLKLEHPVLSRLPSNLLLFLVQTCIQSHARPRVISIVAMELDERLRKELSGMTGIENYQFGDLTRAAIRSYTGKETYKFGDLTRTTVKKYTGKEQYEFGDLTKTTIQHLIQAKENYEFGDITKAVVGRLTGRQEQVANYKFGDISRAILAKVSGKEHYQFGDITRGLLRQARADEGTKDTAKSKQYRDDVDRQLELLSHMKMA